MLLGSGHGVSETAEQACPVSVPDPLQYSAPLVDVGHVGTCRDESKR